MVRSDTGEPTDCQSLKAWDARSKMGENEEEETVRLWDRLFNSIDKVRKLARLMRALSAGIEAFLAELGPEQKKGEK